MSEFFVPDDFKETFQIERQAAGSYVGGVWTPGGAASTITVKDSSVQPATAQQVQMLPEGRRNSASLAIFTSTPVYTLDEAAKTDPDVIIARGRRWEVLRVFEHMTPWAHYEVIASLIDGQ